MPDENGNPHYFISFCYDDNKAPEGRKGWVDVFTTELELKYGKEAALKHLKAGQEQRKGFGYSFSKIHDQGVIDEWIEREIRKSDFLIALMSPFGCSSPYCREERKLFESKVCKGKRSEFGERVFIVQLHPELPDDLRGLRGTYEFYKTIPGGRTQRLGEPIPDPVLDRDFFDKIHLLSTVMAEKTHDLFQWTRSGSKQARRPLMSGAAKPEKIYVEGEAEIDSKFVRDTAARLRENGYAATRFSEVHDGVDPSQADPEADFKNLVDWSDIVVVVRQAGSKDFTRNRHKDARALFRYRKKNPRNVLLVDASRTDTLAAHPDKRIFSLANAKAHQCADRVANEVGGGGPKR